MDVRSLVRFTQAFQECEDEAFRTHNNDMYRVYLAASSRHGSNTYGALTDDEFVRFLHAVGYKPLQPSVMSVLLRRAKDLASSDSAGGLHLAAPESRLGYRAFVAAFILLSMMAEPPAQTPNAGEDAFYYATFARQLERVLVPHALYEIDGKAAADVRRNADINELLFVYWDLLATLHRRYAAQRAAGRGECSARLAEALSEHMELENWLAFAGEAGFDEALTRCELVAVAKACQVSDKEARVNYASAGDRAFVGSTMLDLPEFMNALVRCAFVAHDGESHTPVQQAHSLLVHLEERFADVAWEKSFAAPVPPALDSLRPREFPVCRGGCECDFELDAAPLCERRGVYVRVGTFNAVRYRVAPGQTRPVKGRVPQFPDGMRYREPSANRLAEVQRWEKAVLRGREIAEDVDIACEPPCLGEAGPFRTDVVVELTVDEHACTVDVQTTFRYAMEVSLSSDGHTFTTTEGSDAEIFYTDPQPSYSLPEALVATLRSIFTRYCQHDDLYNDRNMTFEKWSLFKLHYGVIEPEVAIFSSKRTRACEAVCADAAREAADKRSAQVRRRYARWSAREWCGRLPPVDARRAAAAAAASGKGGGDNGGESDGDESDSGSEAGSAGSGGGFAVGGDGGGYGGGISGVAGLRSTVRRMRGRRLCVISFEEFLRTLVKSSLCLRGVVDTTEHLSSVSRAGQGRLARLRLQHPRVRRPRHLADDSVVATAASLTRRACRCFDVYEGAVLLGVVGEGAGWVERHGRLHANAHACWEPLAIVQTSPTLQDRLWELFRAAPSFDVLLRRLRLGGFLVGPSSGDPRTRACVSRLYEVSAAPEGLGGDGAEGSAGAEEEEEVVAEEEEEEAEAVVGHLWEYPGSLCSLTWQAAEGELQHRQATMVVYQEEHFHAVFEVFSSTQTLTELRTRLMRSNYVLSLKY